MFGLTLAQATFFTEL